MCGWWCVSPPRRQGKKSKKGKIDPATAKKVQAKLAAALLGQDAAALFRKYDKSGDGDLDAAELKNMIRRDLKISPADLPDDDVDKLIKALDDDGGGSLSIDELLDFVEVTQLLATTRHIRLVYTLSLLIHSL